MNQETYSCHLTEDCGAKLKCGAESIHVEFPKELFGEVNGADNITPAIIKTDAGYEIGRDFEIFITAILGRSSISGKFWNGRSSLILKY